MSHSPQNNLHGNNLRVLLERRFEIDEVLDKLPNESSLRDLDGLKALLDCGEKVNNKFDQAIIEILNKKEKDFFRPNNLDLKELQKFAITIVIIV